MANEQGLRPQENVLMMFNRFLDLAAASEQEALLKKCRTLILDMKQAYLEIQPVYTEDVVEVVRCRDCKHFNGDCCFNIQWWDDDYFTYVNEDDFCSYGERKSDVKE